VIRILNAEPDGYSPQARDILCNIGQLDERPITRAELLRDLSHYDILIVRLKFHIDREVLDAGRESIKAIVTATTGLNHVDLDYARQLGVTVLSLRGETEFLRGVTATAEHTWALLLGLIRHVPQAFASVQAGQWNRDDFRGSQLTGKHLGILGLGRLGTQVARYGSAFGMQVLGYDPYVTDWPDNVLRCATLSDLLEESDILSIHVSLTDETRSMLQSAELNKLPAGALVINTARGEVIDEAALVQALETGHLAGAAVDVVIGEHNSAQALPASLLVDYARTHTNVIITPHIGGATNESMAATEVFMANKLRNFLLSSDTGLA
jgi:D-3-phosphoglycerate dehydrogenase / 2-oxoglutarate reductase